jgi:hypothetical protein
VKLDGDTPFSPFFPKERSRNRAPVFGLAEYTQATVWPLSFEDNPDKLSSSFGGASYHTGERGYFVVNEVGDQLCQLS